MEYIIFGITCVLFLLIIFINGVLNNRKAEREFVRKLESDYGKKAEREYKLERFSRLQGYYKKHISENQIDDITWNDLGMDEIFKRMNYTLSSTGEEYLYYTLRTSKKEETFFKHFEELTAYFSEQKENRLAVQLLMHKLGSTGNYSLYDYLDYLETLGERSNGKIFFTNVLFFVFAGCCFWNLSIGLLGVVIIVIYHILTYFKEKAEIEPYLISFHYVMRLLAVCEKLEKLQIPVCQKEWEIIHEKKKKLNKVKKGSFWVLSGTRGSTGGSPLEIILDYIRMVFHIDLIQFNKMLAELRKSLTEVDEIITQIGLIETAICIGEYRASLQDGWCIPKFEGEKLQIKNAYHPLINHPVKNSITAKNGVLLTGSNASGKSTFLKTIALNVILAQTINTCMAGQYQAPFFKVYSSMSLRDDILHGESYYIVEIKALKRILDAGILFEDRILCFVDEVLRGTNTVERIAASAQILKSLVGSKMLCFAATHDIELTELLQDYYENYHFEEEIKDGDIYFNYQLQKGKASSRNAIKLLEIMGYKKEIIEKATRQAEHFVKSGLWELT